MQQLKTKPDVRLVSLRPPYRFESPYEGEGFVLLLHSDDTNVSDEVQSTVAKAIVASGCRYVCCSGIECDQWHDAVDWAFLESDPNYDPPDERFVMTTSHEKESAVEVVWFALNLTWFDDFEPNRVLIALLSPEPGRAEDFAAAVIAG